MGIRKPLHKLLSSVLVLPTFLLSSPPGLSGEAHPQTEAVPFLLFQTASSVSTSSTRHTFSALVIVQIELLDLRAPG